MAATTNNTSPLALVARKSEIEARLLELGHRKFMSRSLPPCTETEGTHYDYLLKEMAWMANDFRSERKWKLSSAKKLAREVVSMWTKRDTDAKRAARTEAARLRKVAQGIARTVKKTFWDKIDRIVLFKSSADYVAEQNAASAKSLDFLISQTERYTKLLVNKIVPTSHEAHKNLSRKARAAEELEAERVVMEDLMSRYADVPLATISSSSPVNVESPTTVSPSNNNTDHHHHHDEDDASFHPPSESSGEEDGDDESLARAEQNRDDDGQAECLEADMNMSIEELLRTRYGNLPSSEEPEPTPPIMNGSATTTTAPEPDGDDNSYIASSSSTDASAEEDLARDEQANNEFDDGDAAGLDADMNIPIEELLKTRYGNVSMDDASAGDNDDASSSSSSSPNLQNLLLDQRPTDDDDVAPTHPTSDGDDEEYTPTQETDSDESLASEIKHDPDDDGNADALVQDMELPLEELLRRRYSHTSPATTTTTTTQPPPPRKEKFTTPLPFLLSHDRPLRDYQRAGIDWLVSLHDRRLNGILADEMGLGKTIQTIALLAHLAGSKGQWGPHLIIVPTSVVLNWETEFKHWCPAMRVLSYFGSTKEREAKRLGWTKPNAFHVCITSYQLAVQDAAVFRRRHWYYLICDEAHALKNAKSQRWQTLMSLQSKRRLLLTGTPLQNSLMELWSLMHFLMPTLFRSQSEFKHWFSNPLMNIVEGGGSVQPDNTNNSPVHRLHGVMRPFILRRLKRDVAKQLPDKFEHIVKIPLARRQRFLYEDFISRASTRQTMQGGGYVGKMAVLMQLRMVCNHPDLFEPRLVASPLSVDPISVAVPTLVFGARPRFHDEAGLLMELSASRSDVFGSGMGDPFPFGLADRELCGGGHGGSYMSKHHIPILASPQSILACRRAQELGELFVQVKTTRFQPCHQVDGMDIQTHASSAKLVAQVASLANVVAQEFNQEQDVRNAHVVKQSRARHHCTLPMYGAETVLVAQRLGQGVELLCGPFTLAARLDTLMPVLERFVFVTPKARTVHGGIRVNAIPRVLRALEQAELDSTLHTIPLPNKQELLTHPIAIRQALSFPDKMLVQYDCGKLVALATMLHRLKRGGHRVLIFTQMSKTLDILEVFLNLHAHTYYRLDGATKVEDRQTMMERFNRDPRIFCFILSTRAGGLGINLTGADTVIFYDSDWNPSMDAQAQDRAHRIGQTKTVHIYRLVSESTVEENIMLKASQKRHLNRLTVEDGRFNLDFLTEEGDESAVKAAMLEVEDDADKAAAARAEQEAKEEEAEYTLEDATTTTPGIAVTTGLTEEPLPTPPPATAAVGTTGDDFEDDTGTVLMSTSQYESLASNLREIDLYGLDFRTNYLPVVDKMKEQRHLARLQQIAAEQKDWELDALERERTLEEEEGDDEFISSSDHVLSEAAAEATMNAARRAIVLERRIRKLTGRNWVIRYDGMRPYYLCIDTNQTTWERPTIMDAEQERTKAKNGGWAQLMHAVLARIASYLPGFGRAQGFQRVCYQWWKAVSRNINACLWVAPVGGTREFMVGTAVEARFNGGVDYYAGTIMARRTDGTCDILYSDGETELRVDPALIKLDAGERYTLVYANDGSVLEVFNPRLASQFGCGATPVKPRFVATLQDACGKAQPGDVIVLGVGQHVGGPSLNQGVFHGVRFVSETAWIASSHALQIGLDRVLPDVVIDETAQSKKTPQLQHFVVDPLGPEFDKCSVVMDGEVMFETCRFEGLLFRSIKMMMRGQHETVFDRCSFAGVDGMEVTNLTTHGEGKRSRLMLYNSWFQTGTCKLLGWGDANHKTSVMTNVSFPSAAQLHLVVNVLTMLGFEVNAPVLYDGPPPMDLMAKYSTVLDGHANSKGMGTSTSLTSKRGAAAAVINGGGNRPTKMARRSKLVGEHSTVHQVSPLPSSSSPRPAVMS